MFAQNILRGFNSFFRGIYWLKNHPWYALILFIPMLISGALMFSAFGLFIKYQTLFFDWVMFQKPEHWLGILLYFLVKGLLFVGVLMLGFLVFILFSNVLSAPIFEYVSCAIEKDLTGQVKEISLLASLRLLGEELKKVLFILALSTLILLIPVVNILSPIAAAFFAGWDIYDYPLARRGFTFRKRWKFVLKHSFSVLGLGFWLIIPGVQLFLMPLAVAGASILAIEDLTS